MLLFRGLTTLQVFYESHIVYLLGAPTKTGQHNEPLTGKI